MTEELEFPDGQVPWEPYTLEDWFQEEERRRPGFLASLEERMPARLLGNDLAVRREDLGLSQAELAEHTGIKQPMICRIERGQEPTLKTLRKLAAALQVDIVIGADGASMRVVPIPSEVVRIAA